MPILHSIIVALITLCLIALAFYLIDWVLTSIGISIPPVVVNIIKVILVLIAILVLAELFLPMITNMKVIGAVLPNGLLVR